ncbi:segregation/condensation protein A [archaeon]|jgi:segregation and condensation protein A|nr:segregation/condensation protein A [archaeon]
MEEEKIQSLPSNRHSHLPEEEKNSVNQEQVHDLLFNREVGWQDLIYDLINSEQLDPWDINIIVLTDKFLERLESMEGEDFFISSKVLLAAALLLRIKSEVLLNSHLSGIDEILFGKKEQRESRPLERIELDEEIPKLIPRSPIPRLKKVTLNELIESLNKAIKTENRRIKKEIIKKNALRETSLSLPKKKTISIKDKIRQIYDTLFDHFEVNDHHKNITYTDFIKGDKEERLFCFYPLLQLENQQKVWLHQEEHFAEINIWMKETYLKHNGDPFADLKQELINQEKEELEMVERKIQRKKEIVLEKKAKEERRLAREEKLKESAPLGVSQSAEFGDK